VLVLLKVAVQRHLQIRRAFCKAKQFFSSLRLSVDGAVGVETAITRKGVELVRELGVPFVRSRFVRRLVRRLGLLRLLKVLSFFATACFDLSRLNLLTGLPFAYGFDAEEEEEEEHEDCGCCNWSSAICMTS